MTEIVMTPKQMKAAAKKLRRAVLYMPKELRLGIILDAYDLENGIIPGTPESARFKRDNK